MAFPPRPSSSLGKVAPAGEKKPHPFQERKLTGGYRHGQEGGTKPDNALATLGAQPDAPGKQQGQQQQRQQQRQQEQQQQQQKQHGRGNNDKSMYVQRESSAVYSGVQTGYDADVPIVDRLPFNFFVSATVFLNILVLGLEQDFGPGPTVPMSERFGWYMLEVCFSVLFALEVLVRVYCHRRTYFFDAWNVFDAIIVAAALVDSLFLVPAGIGGLVRFFTVVRALRVIRLVKLVRMFPVFRELWLLVGGLVSSVKALGWVGLIIILTLYVCSIVVTTEIGQNDELYSTGPSYNGEVWPYQSYFGNVWRSMFTLFQMMTLDGWCDDIVRHVIYRQPLMGIFFIAFLMLTAFGLLNVVIGIIVENTLAAAQVADRRSQQHEVLVRRVAVEQLLEILLKSDMNKSGKISLEELKAANQSRVVQEKFEKIGLTFDEAKAIFGLLDYEGKGSVELTRFVGSCKELVGGAKRRDIAQVEVTVGMLAQRLNGLSKQFSKIEGDVHGLQLMADGFIHNTVRLLTGFDGSRMPPQGSSRTSTGHRAQ